jgi:hypothetical protein
MDGGVVLYSFSMKRAADVDQIVQLITNLFVLQQQDPPITSPVTYMIEVTKYKQCDDSRKDKPSSTS